ncbi:NTP transferase domain-containing protein [uncultured Sphingomonas sp.]|uniref:NTP transferase domain-containing protein n=1 Tax=uncultured Sphingomonas sp. TaxID=158754 RepID=UPI0025DFC81E|nr:NTP transferase domain-containing protein [uncultured Sphingomonas sp.]
MSRDWTAILLAGQRPGTDPLAAAFGQEWKALVPIAGEAMLARVARTLLASPSVARVLILAQQPEQLLVGDCAWLGANPRVATACSTRGIASSIAAVAGTQAAPWPVLATTADHPLLTVEMVEHFIAGADGYAGAGAGDVAVGMVNSAVLLAAYPDNRRTWLSFSDGRWTGANLFALRTDRAAIALKAWSGVEQDRKKAIKLVWHFGAWLAIRALTRTITLRGAMRRAARRLGFHAVPVALPFAEAGIDVDKPSDHALATAILDRRG